MRFLLDAMLPPSTVDLLIQAGHAATSPALIGADTLPDDELVLIATAQRWVIVTENGVDFFGVRSCPVLVVRKSWWPRASLPARLAAALDRWAIANPEPGPWPHWLPPDLR
ncbi:MAG: DUF5615 family PIN-like protein [Sporichthyaceae bacterium]